MLKKTIIFLKNNLPAIIVFIIIGQTLFFKFTGQVESVELFTKLGVESIGRIITAIIELIAIILIIIPKTRWIGSMLTSGILFVALILHLFVIGIESNQDGGALFILAIIGFVFSLISLYLNKVKLFEMVKKMNMKK